MRMHGADPAECHKADELKDIRDKAIALEHYYRQARNTEAEWKVTEIRVRAERRVGQLLKDMERSPLSKGGDTKSAVHDELPISEYANALAGNHIPSTSAKRYQSLAAVPDAES